MKKVLIVDDTAVMRKSIRLILESSGYDVVGEAESGTEGLDKYVSLRPDVVALAVVMPGMDGVQTLKAILQHNSRANVVMVSDMGQEPVVRNSIIFGAKDFIVKPFKPEQVLSVFSKIAPL